MMANEVPGRRSAAERRPQKKSWIVFAALIIAMGVLVFWQRNTWQRLLGMQQDRDPRPASNRDNRASGEFQPVVVIPRAFPPITDVPVAKVEEVMGPGAKTPIRDDELILGVEIDGQSRAYPINMLTGPQREIVNDTVGGAAIAATW